MESNVFLRLIGYIGGTVLEYLHKSHPEYEYTLLVRDEKRGLPIQAKYPNAKLIYGSLEDFELISGAAAYADIVIGKNNNGCSFFCWPCLITRSI